MHTYIHTHMHIHITLLHTNTTHKHSTYTRCIFTSVMWPKPGHFSKCFLRCSSVTCLGRFLMIKRDLRGCEMSENIDGNTSRKGKKRRETQDTIKSQHIHKHKHTIHNTQHITHTHTTYVIAPLPNDSTHVHQVRRTKTTHFYQKRKILSFCLFILRSNLFSIS